MSYKSKFKYNEAYSNEDISEALSILTGSGIAPDTPNEILSNYADSGVTYEDERLKVSISGTEVTVGCGTAIMGDGSYIIIYEPEIFTVSFSETYYIYLKYNTVGDISVKCETEQPTGQYDMLLATVTNNVVADKRTYAVSKVANYGGSSLHELELIKDAYRVDDSWHWYIDYKLPNYGYSLIIISYGLSDNGFGGNKRNIIYDTKTKTFVNNATYLHSSSAAPSGVCAVSSITISGSKATIETNYTVSSNEIKVYCV